MGYENTDDIGDAAGEMGDDLLPVNVGTGRTVKDVSCGSESTCAILDDDSVKCWGRARLGQLGNGDDQNDVGKSAGTMGDNLAAINLGTGRTAKQVDIFALTACAVLDDDTLKCWGSGN